MSDRISGWKLPGVGPRQGTSSEKGASSSDMSVYKSSAEESVGYKGIKDSSIYKSSEEYFEYSCDSCKTVGAHVEARGFCTDCDEYLCGTCFRTHSRNKASQHHALLDKDAMPRKARIIICDACKTVEDEVVAVGYCEDCNDYLCDRCYKSHSRNKSSRHHMLMDKDSMSEESERAVASTIAKVNIHKKGGGTRRYNKHEYTHVRNINVTTDTDKEDCYITEIVIFSNTELVLCDNDNKCLKLFDIDNSIVKDVLALETVPNGITAISNDKVAVALHNKYQILIISIRGGLSVIRTIRTNGNCLGVQFTNGKLYASFNDPVQFQIIKQTGSISKTIKPNSEVLKHCTHPFHFAVSLDETLIYVSDWRTKKAMSIGMNGKLHSVCHCELEGPDDIKLSPFGSVYLCDGNQRVVYSMTPDLREATVVLGPGDGLDSPRAMCFNTDKQHLYISSGSADARYGNFLKVYQWEYTVKTHELATLRHLFLLTSFLLVIFGLYSFYEFLPGWSFCNVLF